jgi:L-lysine exporter family protein LysE/ArgO
MFIVLGLLIGFAAAIPLGPVNVFVVSQTLKRDFSHGLLAGITTAVLDFVYCLVALVGLFQIRLAPIPAAMPVMKAVAGLIVILIGYRLVRDSRTFSLPQEGDRIPSASARPIIGVILLYVTNPSLYIFWLAVAGTMTGQNLVRNSGWTAVAFAAAAGLGSLAWYILLVRFVARRQFRIRPRTFRKILYYLGLALTAFGVYTIGTIFL